MQLSQRLTHLICTAVAFTVMNVCGADTVPDTSKNVPPGSRTSVPMAFFKMGDMRLINNMWGSKEMNCSDAQYSIFVNQDKSFGWEFRRGDCPGGSAKPDYPEVEFGIHPFGTSKDLVTSPDFTSTTLLPIQIKDVKTANVKIEDLKVEMYNNSAWNVNFEMWFCDQHPVTGKHSMAYAELMAWWGWNDGWACSPPNDNVTAGSNSYSLCHLESWRWQYYQFRMNGGGDGTRNYNGTVDVKAFLDYLVNQKGYSKDLWISRFEVGTEISNNTSGKVTIKNLTFEINGVSKFPEFFDPTAIENYSSQKKINNMQPLKLHAFPAGSTIEVIDLRGKRATLHTGAQPISAVELSKTLPAGVYMMSIAGVKGSAVVVPVVR